VNEGKIARILLRKLWKGEITQEQLERICQGWMKKIREEMKKKGLAGELIKEFGGEIVEERGRNEG